MKECAQIELICDGFQAEPATAIAASVGRRKDAARIEQMRQEADVDEKRLEKILQRHKLKLPK